MGDGTHMEKLSLPLQPLQLDSITSLNCSGWPGIRGSKERVLCPGCVQGEEDALPSDIQMLKRQAKAAYGSNNILAAYDFYTHHVSCNALHIALFVNAVLLFQVAAVVRATSTCNVSCFDTSSK